MKRTVLYSSACVFCLSLCAATERVELSEGWWHTANHSLAYPFTVERMADWLDDMGRELMADPGSSRRPPQDPQHPFAEAGHARREWEGWEPVRVPHDRALDHGFDYDRSSADGCVDPGVQGWYRRDLDIPASAKGRRVFFECDGAASFAMVWVNGRFVGGWPYAYTPWRVELTPYLDFGGTNTLAVRTAFVPQAARYYTGAGLYRPCHLAFCDPDHLVPGSVAIRTALDGDVAHVTVTYAMSESGARTKAFDVAKPRLWDVNDPHLYEVEIEGEHFRYGIRTFAFHADDRRFQLNGRTVPIRGVCLHQDLDVLGAVWNRSAWERRLRKLREAGVNAIRMSHYRHPAGVYDLCDEMGFLVMDEVFDQWSGAFNANDYHRLFPRWHERDLRASVRANRNHPCIVLWGVGNEIVEQRDDLGQFDLALFERNGRALTAIAHEEDPTRPVTTANNNASVVTSNEVDFVDVYGFNYRWNKFAEHRAARPARPAISTETGCYIAGRGEYFFPIKSDWSRTDLHSSSYLNIAICKVEDEWGAHEATTGHAGGFYWTGFDYLGGPASTPHARRKPTSVDPAVAARWKEEIALYGSVRASIRACATGFFDLAGFPRDVYWQFKARWCPDEPTLHLLPHWNWPERVGEKTPVTAFSSGDEVELFVNGKSQGRRRQPLAGGRFTWEDVVYQPGALKAVAYRNGERWTETTVETTGPVARLALSPEAPSVAADGESVAYVNLSALDAQGRVVPRTRLPVSVTVSGGELIGVENGDDADLTHFKAKDHVVYNGHLSVVVRAKPGETGPIRVTVASEGLSPVDCVVPVERRHPLVAWATLRTTLTNGVVSTVRTRGETLCDGTVRVTVPASSIAADVATVDVIHPAFTATKGTPGYWLGPRGQLGYFTRDQAHWTTDVYNNNLIMPYCGFKSPAGMVTCWIRGLRFESELRLETERGRTEFFPRLRVAKMGCRPYEDWVLEFRNLGPEAEYSEAARLFRETRLRNGEIVPLVEKMKTRSEVAYLRDTFTARLPMFAAKPRQPGDQTPETEPPVKMLYTPAQAERLMEELKAAGVEKMEFCASGWTTGGYDGRFPSFFPCEESIGGDAAVRHLAETAKRLGYRLGLQSAYTGAFRISPRWSEDIVCKNPDGSLLRGETYWCGGDTYRVCVERARQLFLDEDMKGWKALGVNGANYLDVFTAISPCPCCDPNHRVNRAEAAEAQRKIAERCIEELGGFASECGEDHLVNELSYINYVSADMKRWQGYGKMEKIANQEEVLPLRCPDPSQNAIDEIVPFWEIVYHGFVYHPTDRLTQDHTSAKNRKHSPRTWLLSVEFGGRPIPYIAPTTPAAEIVRAYEDYKPLARLSTVFMDSHRRLSDDVRLVTYADGTEVVVNYGDEPCVHRGQTVAAVSYRVYSPE